MSASSARVLCSYLTFSRVHVMCLFLHNLNFYVQTMKLWNVCVHTRQNLGVETMMSTVHVYEFTDERVCGQIRWLSFLGMNRRLGSGRSRLKHFITMWIFGLFRVLFGSSRACCACLCGNQCGLPISLRDGLGQRGD